MSAKKKAQRKAADLSKEALQAIVKRLTSGETTLFHESEKAGLTPNTPLRNALTKHLGGKQQYTAMIQRGMKKRAEQNAA